MRRRAILLTGLAALTLPPRPGRACRDPDAAARAAIGRALLRHDPRLYAALRDARPGAAAVPIAVMVDGWCLSGEDARACIADCERVAADVG